MDSMPAETPKEVLVDTRDTETAGQEKTSSSNLKLRCDLCHACPEQLDEASSSDSSQHSSTASSYQQWADAEPLPIYFDDWQEQEKTRIKKSMQTELLTLLSPVLQQQLGPRVLTLKESELRVLTGESLTITQKRELVNRMEALAAVPGEALQEFDRWLQKAVYQNRVTQAEEHQQLQRQQKQQDDHRNHAIQDSLERQIREWRADACDEESNPPWQATFLARHAIAQYYLERAATKQHQSHMHLFKSFLIAGRWAGFPYWQHPPAEPGKRAPLGEPSSCSLCCHALGIPKLEAAPSAAQHSRLERWFGSCLAPSVKATSSSSMAQPSVTASIRTARNTSAAARPSVLAKQGQNWESDFFDPARLFVQHDAVQDTFGRTDATVQPDSKPSRSSITRGSSIYWELYSAPSMAAQQSRPSLPGQGAKGAPAGKSVGQQSGSKLRKLFSRRCT